MPNSHLKPDVPVPAGWETVGSEHADTGEFFCPACSRTHRDGAECPDVRARRVYTALGIASPDAREAEITSLREKVAALEAKANPKQEA